MPRPTPGGGLHADVGGPVRPPGPDDQRDDEEGGAYGEEDDQDGGWDHIDHQRCGGVGPVWDGGGA